MSLAAITILVSSFLLFQVQPMVGKLILPWFGGAASVWTTCMLFFQALLLVGYWYADVSVSKLSAKTRAALHFFLVIAASLFLVFEVGTQWRPSRDESPVLFIILYLTITIGLPYLALSSTAPLVQGVLGRSGASLKVYKLYAISNFASLLALLSYPSIFERFFPLSQQIHYWSIGFYVYAALSCLFLLQKQVQVGGKHETSHRSNEPQPSSLDTLKWFFYSAVGCMVLLGSTNHICQNIASIPFLWIVPLSLYLLSFIVAFAQTEAYSRRLFVPLFLASAAALFWLEQGGIPPLSYLLLASTLLTFSGCVICHGEVAAHKPTPRFLTRFYFVMSFGSVFGSILVVFIAPLVFRFYSEYPLSLLLCTVIALCSLSDRTRYKGLSTRVLLVGTALALVGSLLLDRMEDTIASRRNFFGVLYVKEKNRDVPEYHFYRMFHGEVVHGLQFQKPEKRLQPTSYYGESSGIGRIMNNYRPRQIIHTGVVGLGVGTIAAYGRKGDTIRFYEINQAVVDLAKDHFRFLSETPAEVSIVVGDGRLALEAEAAQNFDVLLLDAFSGDSVPMHLLTSEALGEYLRHLSPTGVLVFHITNYHIDLVPVVVAAGDAHGLSSFYVRAKGDRAKGQTNSKYLVLTRSENSTIVQGALDNAPQIKVSPADQRLWTDDFSDLLRVVKW